MSHSPLDESSADGQQAYCRGWRAVTRLLREGRSWSGNERNTCFLNTAGSRFADVSAIAGWDLPDDSRALALVDWDHDGDLDVWVSNRNGPRVRFLRNQGCGRQHYLAVRLEGRSGNRDAVGARLEAIVGGDTSRRLTRSLRAGEGFLGQSSKWLHFGLGDAERVDRLVIRWPGGPTETITDLPADRHCLIIEGSGRAVPVAANRPVALLPSSAEPPRASPSVRTVLPGRLPLPPGEYEDFTRGTAPLAPAPARPRLVTLWATWCAPCLKELRSLSAAKAKLDAAGLDVLALSVNGLDDDDADVSPEAMLEDLAFPFLAGRATGELIEMLDAVQRALFNLERPLPLPASFLLDAQGRLAVVYKGPVSPGQVLKDLRLLEAAPAELRAAASPFAGRWIDEATGLDLIRIARILADRGQSPLAEAMLRRHLDLAQTDGQITLRDRQIRANIHLYLGDLLRDEGRDARAMAEYRSAVEMAPHAWRGYVEMGRLHLARDDHDRAAERFAEALRRRPNDPDTLGYLALAERRRGDVAAAVRHYREALRLRPGWPQVANNLAWLLATSSDPQIADPAESVRLAELACYKTGRTNLTYLDTLATACASAARHAEARDVLLEAIALARRQGQPGKANELRERLESLDSAGAGPAEPAATAEDSAATLWRLLRTMEFPNAAGRRDARRALAWILATDADPRVRDGRLALRLMRDAPWHEHDQHDRPTPDFRDADVLAAACAEVERFDEAVELADRAARAAIAAGSRSLAEEIQQRVRLYRQRLPARQVGASLAGGRPAAGESTDRLCLVLTYFAHVLRRQGHPALAVEAYQDILRREPGLRGPRLEVARIWIEAGRYREAERHLSEVLQVNRDDAEALACLAMCARGQGRIREAVLHYDRALVIRPAWPEVANNLAWLLATQADPRVRDPSRALELARRACEAGGDDRPTFLGTLAAAHASSGEFDRAVEIAAKARAIALSSRRHDLTRTLAEQRDRYAARQPLRESVIFRTAANQELPATPNLAARREIAGDGEVSVPLPLPAEWVPVLTRLAWLLATHEDPRVRDPHAAERLARIACEATSYRRPLPMHALASALTACGQDGRASAMARAARSVTRDAESAPAERLAAWSEGIRERLSLGDSGGSKPRTPGEEPPNVRLAMQYYLLGEVLLEHALGREGWASLEQAVRLAPRFRAAHLTLGREFLAQARYEEASAHFSAVLRSDPEDAECLAHLARGRRGQGRIADAVARFTEALRLRPHWPRVANELAWLLATSDDARIQNPVEAIRLAEQACSATEHRDAAYLDTLAAAYASAGRFDDAVQTAERSLNQATSSDHEVDAEPIPERLDHYRRRRPYVVPVGEQDDPLSVAHLALARRRQNRSAEAIELYRDALRLQPQWPQVANNLAWLLATETRTLRDPERAVELARQACRLTHYRQPEFLETLAVAHAANGQLPEALQAIRRAIDLSVLLGQDQRAAELTERLRELSAPSSEAGTGS